MGFVFIFVSKIPVYIKKKEAHINNNNIPIVPPDLILFDPLTGFKMASFTIKSGSETPLLLYKFLTMEVLRILKKGYKRKFDILFLQIKTL